MSHVHEPNSQYEPFPGCPAEDLVTSGEIAKILRVHPKTVTRWATDGRLRSVATPGGHHRFRVGDVREMMRQAQQVAL